MPPGISRLLRSLNLMERSTFTEGIVCPPLMNALTYPAAMPRRCKAFGGSHEIATCAMSTCTTCTLVTSGIRTATPNVFDCMIRRCTSTGTIQHLSTLQRSPLRGSELHFMASQVHMDRFASNHLRLVPF